MPTDYNKFSCRSCGFRLIATKVCRHCGEPVVWHCPSCLARYDSTHVHDIKQEYLKAEELARAEAC